MRNCVGGNKYYFRFNQAFISLVIFVECIMEESVFQEIMAKEREKITDTIKEIISEKISAEEDMVLRTFYQQALDNFLIKGRRRLPIAFINTYYGLTPESIIVENFEEMYRIATSIEFLYAASIIHDDIVDNEELRGGIPTFHKFFEKELTAEIERNKSDIKKESLMRSGASLAMFGGNILMGIGLTVLNSSAFPESIISNATHSYIRAYHAVNRSQILEEYLKLKPLEQVTLEEYLLHAQNNRGALYENAVGIASVFANSRSAQNFKLREVFSKVGVCSQIVNDIQGSFGNKAEKSISKDIISGKHTILSIIAYQNGNDEQKSVLKAILGKADASADEIERIRGIYIDTGAVDFAKMYAANMANLAQRGLIDVFPGLKRDAYEFFISYIDMVSNINL